MRKRAVAIAIILITIAAVVYLVHGFITSDPIHYFTARPHRLLYVAAIAASGGILVSAFSRLPLAVRQRLALIWKYAAALIIAYLVAWTGVFVFLCRDVGESMRWDLYGLYLLLAWTSEKSELLNRARVYSVIGFVPLALAAIWMVHGSEQQKHA